MKFLRSSEIIEINRTMISRYGGLHNGRDNIRNRNSFEYLVDFVKDISDLESVSIYHIAAKYAQQIIKGHIFFDGNKRTGIFTSIVFLKINGVSIKDSVDSDLIVELALKIESGKYNLETISKWFEINTYHPK